MIEIAPLLKVADMARAAWQRDRDHIVVLDADFFVGAFRQTFTWRGRELPILDAEVGHVAIVRRELWILRGAKGDGASCFPDKVGKVDLAPAYIPHDEIYEDMEAIAEIPGWKAAGWTPAAVRALADCVFAVMARREELRDGHTRGFLSRFLYNAVRGLGWVWHKIAGTGVVLLVCITLAGGCAGCLSVPDDVFDPSGDKPTYHVESREAAK